MGHKTLVLLLLVTGLLFHPHLAHSQNTSHSYNDMANEILRLINDHRTEMKLSPLKANPVVSQAAEKHSHNMATKKIPFGHDGFDQRMAGIGKQLRSVYGWAENVAEGSQNAKEVVDLWLTSKVHRENIEGDYNLAGIGIAKGADGNLYFTAIFINKGK